MGSPEAFQHRKLALAELKRANHILHTQVTDEEVAKSFLDQISSTNTDFFSFLKEGVIALTIGDVLFIHGGLHEKNLGYVCLQNNNIIIDLLLIYCIKMVAST